MIKVQQQEKPVLYIGNRKFCWEDSVSMLLSTIGEEVSPSYMAAISGCGLSAFLDKRTDYLFFNFAIPNEELTYDLKKLGFEIKEVLIPKSQEIPLAELRCDLKGSPAVVGPIDMGFLKYNPDYRFLGGSDHFVLVYDSNPKGFFLHDPAGYPNVYIDNEDFKKCLRSRNLMYGSDYYRYWTKPKRIKRPSEKEVFEQTIKDYKSIYNNCDIKSLKNNWITGDRAILKEAERIGKLQFKKEEIDLLVYFSFPFAIQMSLAIFDYLKSFDERLAGVKAIESQLFGIAQVLAMGRNWDQLSMTLREIAKLEKGFRLKILAK